MLGWRVLISCVVVPLLIALFWFDSGLGRDAPVLLAFCLAVALRCGFEISDLLKTRAMRPLAWPVMVASALIVLSGWAHVRFAGDSPSLLTSLGWIAITFVAGFCGLLFLEAIRYQQPGNSMESLGAHLTGVIYTGGLLAVTAQFRWFPDPRIGYFAIGSMIIAVKSGDIGAYFFGRFLGKRKMAPRLSPGKTWMGAVGAVVGSSLGGTLWLIFGGSLFDAHPAVEHLWLAIVYSASLGVIGLIGDLLESLIKRDVEKKDSAPLMPGFGGLLDMLDSPLFAGPFALAWWHLLPPVQLLVGDV
ncbi:MAG: phosphatidate cytidylyltransferase [Planctomycetaceae bacterium]|nr:phosphatidate cytidylyltransferase [Planctomycetaceae bacterium]